MVAPPPILAPPPLVGPPPPLESKAGSSSNNTATTKPAKRKKWVVKEDPLPWEFDLKALQGSADFVEEDGRPLDWSRCEAVGRSAEGSTGVYFASFPGGKGLAIKVGASRQDAARELFGSLLASTFGVDTPQVRVEQCSGSGGSSAGSFYDRILALVGQLPEHLQVPFGALTAALRRGSPVLVFEFISGESLSNVYWPGQQSPVCDFWISCCFGGRPGGNAHADADANGNADGGGSSGERGRATFENIGRMLALDLLINNLDRWPLIWKNAGNPGNIMLGRGGGGGRNRNTAGDVRQQQGEQKEGKDGHEGGSEGGGEERGERKDEGGGGESGRILAIDNAMHCMDIESHPEAVAEYAALVAGFVARLRQATAHQQEVPEVQRVRTMLQSGCEEGGEVTWPGLNYDIGRAGTLSIQRGLLDGCRTAATLGRPGLDALADRGVGMVGGDGGGDGSSSSSSSAGQHDLDKAAAAGVTPRQLAFLSAVAAAIKGAL